MNNKFWLLLSGILFAYNINAQSHKIQVNPTTSGNKYFRTYEEGVKDIRDLVLKGKKEDLWFFNGTYWIDVGVNSKDSSVTPDTTLITSLISQSISARLVHNHPYDGLFLVDPPSGADITCALRYISEKVSFCVIDAMGEWGFKWKSQEISDKSLDRLMKESIRFLYSNECDELTQKRIKYSLELKINKNVRVYDYHKDISQFKSIPGLNIEYYKK